VFTHQDEGRLLSHVQRYAESDFSYCLIIPLIPLVVSDSDRGPAFAGNKLIGQYLLPIELFRMMSHTYYPMSALTVSPKALYDKGKEIQPFLLIFIAFRVECS
jgi:hypothetical protein